MVIFSTAIRNKKESKNVYVVFVRILCFDSSLLEGAFSRKTYSSTFQIKRKWNERIKYKLCALDLRAKRTMVISC